MSRVLRNHLRRNTVAYIALLVALTSTSYATAASLLPENSVGTRQVVNRSLLARDVKSGQSPAGPRGPSGLTGASGEPGVTGSGGVEIVQASYVGSPGDFYPDALCPAGKKVIGGGIRLRGWGGPGLPQLDEDYPLPDGSGWRARAPAIPPESWVVYAVCAFVS